MYDRKALFRAFAGPMWTGARQHELAVACSAAEAAGAYLLGVFGESEGRPKADGSLVTDADVASDQLIAARLSESFPGDAVLSEELSTHYDGADRVWIVDPLDGTANFCHGVPMWGVTLALVEDGRPVIGVSHFPCLRLTFTAVRGEGAWQGTRRLNAATISHLGANDLVAHCSRTPSRYDISLDGKGRILGSEALNLALVASGAVQASIAATAHVWDLAAGWLLVEEAGGAMALLDGGTVWPLPAADYADRAFATVATGNAALMDSIRDGIRPKSVRA
jgi:myo-inositol-1(or 4)-monophosphatase